MWVKSHNYSINLDNCLHYHSVTLFRGGNGTEFRLTDGSIITITCDYETVHKQVTDAMTVPDLYTVVLEY